MNVNRAQLQVSKKRERPAELKIMLPLFIFAVFGFSLSIFVGMNTHFLFGTMFAAMTIAVLVGMRPKKR